MSSLKSALKISPARLLLICGIISACLVLPGCTQLDASVTTAVPTRGQSEPPSTGGEETPRPQTISPGTGQDAPVSPIETVPANKSTSGKIVGRVYDDRGDPVAGATVGISKGTAPFPEMAYSTNKDGGYQIALPPGKFTVFVNAEGFEFAEQEASVELNQETTLDFKLKQN